MTPAIRLATGDDAAALSQLLAESDNSFDVAAELSRSYARLWVACDVTGPALGLLLSWEVADEVHVLDLVVASSHRRRGIGRALLEFVLERSVQQMARLVLLEVRRGNAAAQGLYRAAGFVENGERKSYYSDGEDALLFQRELT